MTHLVIRVCILVHIIRRNISCIGGVAANSIITQMHGSRGTDERCFGGLVYLEIARIFPMKYYD